MFYYCLDYIGNQKVTVILKKGNNLKFPKRNNYIFIEIDNFLQLLLFIFARKYDLIYTPTPHPIPFATKQIVTLHDFFPFMGFKGAVKYLLFLIAAITSQAKIVLINKFIKSKIYIKVIPLKKIYGPNPIKISNNISNVKKKSYKIGLVGTDSTKKNYEKLFEILPNNIIKNFAIYGNVTDYSIKIINKFGLYGLIKVNSEEHDIEGFINSCDGVVSVARGEGYGRAIALSILHRKPVFLINDPVFKEFFYGSAKFYDTIDLLVEDITYLIKHKKINSVKVDIKSFKKKIKLINKNFDLAKEEIFGN